MAAKDVNAALLILKAPTGRPTKLTPELQENILTLLRLGSYFEVACRACGITKVTGYDWLSRGKVEPNGIYHEFAVEVDKAEAQGEILLIGDVRKHVMNWQASMTVLERRFHDRWGRIDRQEGKLDVTVTSKAEDLTDAELVGIIARGRGNGTVKTPLGTQSAN